MVEVAQPAAAKNAACVNSIIRRFHIEHAALASITIRRKAPTYPLVTTTDV